jgi:hypothetical protein
MEPPTNDIGYAVRALKDGKRVARKYWNDSGTWLEMKPVESRNVPVKVLIHIVTGGEQTEPWNCSQSDLLAEDWFIAYEKTAQ